MIFDARAAILIIAMRGQHSIKRTWNGTLETDDGSLEVGALIVLQETVATDAGALRVRGLEKNMVRGVP